MRVETTMRAVAALAAAALAAGCGESAANQRDRFAFETASVERRTLVSSVEATGAIEPIRVIEVKSQASGEILEMPVELGDHVRRGDLLVRIDPRDVRNAHAQAEADLEVARARLEVASRRLERARILRDSAVVTDQELESAILEHADARAALVKAETNLELARDRLEDVTVRAPLSGTVVEKQVEEGQIVTSTREVTGGTTLLRMADLAEVQVRTLVDETDIGRVAPGLPARITVEAYPDRRFEGRVLKIEPQAVVEQNVTMFAVLTRIANEDDLLRPGMNADVEIVLGRRENVLTLPNAAVKMPEEARRLAGALGLDVPVPAAGDADGGGSGPVRPGSAGPAGRRPPEGLSPEERRSRVRAMRARREAEEAADRADPGRPRPAFVFRRDGGRGLALAAVVVGLSSWEHTEVVRGLEEGDTVLEVPLSLVQQRELLQRFRERSGVPGVSRN